MKRTTKIPKNVILIILGLLIIELGTSIWSNIKIKPRDSDVIETIRGKVLEWDARSDGQIYFLIETRGTKEYIVLEIPKRNNWINPGPISEIHKRIIKDATSLMMNSKEDKFVIQKCKRYNWNYIIINLGEEPIVSYQSDYRVIGKV